MYYLSCFSPVYIIFFVCENRIFAIVWQIALVSDARKILPRIMLESVLVKTETEIADDHVVFRQGSGTESDQTTILECRRHASTSNHSICALWTSTKALDSISHDKLWVTMIDMASSLRGDVAISVDEASNGPMRSKLMDMTYRYPLHLIDLLAKQYRTQLAIGLSKEYRSLYILWSK